MNNIKVIVFDLYNTLIEIKESNNFFYKLFRQSSNRFNIDSSEYLKLVMTNDIDDLISILPSEFKELYEKNIKELESELNSVVVYKEIFTTLDELKKNFQLFMISNLASPYKRPVFQHKLNIYFEKMIFSCDFGLLKPDKEIFQKVEKLTHKNPNEILMIGDSFKSDILGAKNMGWHYLKITRNKKLLKDYEIKNLSEINKHIEE